MKKYACKVNLREYKTYEDRDISELVIFLREVEYYNLTSEHKELT